MLVSIVLKETVHIISVCLPTGSGSGYQSLEDVGISQL